MANAAVSGKGAYQMAHGRRRLLSIAHSYCVVLNRRLAHEMARAGGDEWEVTAVAPSFFHGDLRPIPAELGGGETCRVEIVPAYVTGLPHLFFYGTRLRRILSEPWDVVHCWEEPYVVAGAQVARWTPARAALVFWTGQATAKRYPPPFAAIERYCMERCAGWMARGECGVRTLLPRGYASKPHRIMPLGVDVERFRPDVTARNSTRHRLEWESQGLQVVGFLGRFVEEKGLLRLMCSLDRLALNWRALFVGGGPLEKALRQWALHYPGRVRVVTGVDHDEVPAYLNAMDVLCAPSQTTRKWREIFGRMIVEAFACGVPVVASDSGEIPNVVRDAGIIVGEEDQSGWVQALGDLLDNPAHRAELSKRGTERARGVYAWPVIARQHLAFFNELLDAAGNPGQ